MSNIRIIENNNPSQVRVQYQFDQLRQLSSYIMSRYNTAQVFALTGPLGAGKTTLATALLHCGGVTETITSPTFTYVNRYESTDGRIWYHFDLYRLASYDEFLAAGFEEYLYQPQSVALIEWPEIILPLLTHNVCYITLGYGIDTQERMLEITTS